MLKTDVTFEGVKRKKLLKGHVRRLLKVTTPADTLTLGAVMDGLSRCTDIDFEYNRVIILPFIDELIKEGCVAKGETGQYFWNHWTARCHQSRPDGSCECCGTHLSHVGKTRVCTVCPQTW